MAGPRRPLPNYSVEWVRLPEVEILTREIVQPYLVHPNLRTSLRSVEIATGAFSGPGNLELLDLVGIQTIRAGAFTDSPPSLGELVLPGSLRHVEDDAFDGSGIRTVHIDLDYANTIPNVTYVRSPFVNVELPPGVDLDLPHGFMTESVNLVNVFGMERVRAFGISCFQGCTSLVDVHFGPTALCMQESFADTGIVHLDLREIRPYTLGDGAFDQCDELTTVVLPEDPHNPTRIPVRLLAYCNNLRWVEIPASTMEVGVDAFGSQLNRKVVFVHDRLPDRPLRTLHGPPSPPAKILVVSSDPIVLHGVASITKAEWILRMNAKDPEMIDDFVNALMHYTADTMPETLKTIFNLLDHLRRKEIVRDPRFPRSILPLLANKLLSWRRAAEGMGGFGTGVRGSEIEATVFTLASFYRRD